MRKRIIAGVGAVAFIATLLVGLSPAAEAGGANIRTGPDYKLGTFDDPARGKVGPGLAVDPANNNRIVETQIELTSGECEYNTSTDGGATWPTTGKLVGSPPFIAGPGSCAVLGHGANAMDAGVMWGTGDNVYAAFATSPGGSGPTAALVSRSTDAGQTFPPGVVAIPVGAAGSTGDQSFPKIDVVPGGGTAGADKIVIATNPTRPAAGAHASGGEVLISVSLDSGATWSAPVAANPPPSAVDRFAASEHTQPVFGPAGEIYVGWRTSRVRVSPPDPAAPTPLPPGSVEPGFLRVGKSTDNGATWTQTDVINVQAAPGFGGSSFPRLTIDDASSNLYVVWNQDPGLYAGPFSAQDHFMNMTSQTWIIRSLDDNATWGDINLLSEPIVNGVLTQTRHPNVSVAPNGRVDVVWHDRRHMVRPKAAGNALGPACLHTHFPCVESKLGDTYWSYSTDGGDSFTDGRRVQDRSHNNDVGYDYRFSTYWDFGPVQAHLGNDIILNAWMDSREGNFNTDTQDIYLSKTDMAGGPAAVTNLGLYNERDFAVAMSQKANPGGSEGKQAATFASTSATRVVIANENDQAGILAGAVLARANVGPLLVTPAGGLPPSVQDEVARMEPIGAYLVGNAAQLSPQIEADLIALGVPAANVVPDANVTNGSTGISSPGGLFDLADINHEVSGPGIAPGTKLAYVTTLTGATLSQPATASGNPVTLTIPRIVRLSGPTTADTVAAVARQLDRRTPTERTSGSPAFDAVVVADTHSAVAPTASTLAVARRLPYLHVDQNNVPAATATALNDLNINKTLVLTGNGAVGPIVVGGLTGDGRNPTSFGGATVQAVSEALIPESIARGLPTNQVFVANADKPLHGALLGQSSGRIGGLQLAVPGGSAATAQASATALGIDPGLDRFLTSDVTLSTAAAPVAVFRPSNGVWYFNNGPTVNFGTTGDVQVSADWNGDGVPNDVAVFRPSTGTWYVDGSPAVNFGTSGDIPVAGDYNGDGTLERAVFRPSTGVWYVDGGPVQAFGTFGDIPVPGDYDADGTTDIAVFRPSDSTWYIDGMPPVAWGTTGDIPVPADYDGNGSTDIAVFRPSNGTWYIQGQPPIVWGTNGDIPVAADFDNNGTADIAVFRPSNGTWYVRNGPTVVWGASGDRPIVLSDAIRRAFFA